MLMPLGVIFLTDFLNFHIVKPMLPILTLFPILCISKKNIIKALTSLK